MISGERALVLGGGGASGNAWLVGIIAGMFDAGLDVTEADLIIGTSAGSTTAAQITGASPTRLLSEIIFVSTQQLNGFTRGGDGRVTAKPASDHMERTAAIINAAEDPLDMRRRMGAALLDADVALSFSKQWRTTVAARLPKQDWPQQLMLITAVDAQTGEPVVFDRKSGVDLVDAVAASTAGGFAYQIGDNRYIDGGFRADVNADLAAGYGRILVIPPLGDRTRKPLGWGLHVTAQVEQLRASGSKVETIFPDSDSYSALGVGMNLMDFSTRRPSAEAGYKQSKALAEQLKKFWR